MKESQLGCVPVKLSVAVGTPVVWTVKMPSVSAVKVVLAELIMAGACGTGGASWTLSVKSCVASGRVPFAAVIVREDTRCDAATGGPAKVAVPVDSGGKVTPPRKVAGRVN